MRKLSTLYTEWSSEITRLRSNFTVSQMILMGLSNLFDATICLMIFLTWRVLWAFITLVAIAVSLLLLLLSVILWVKDLLAWIWTALLSIGSSLSGIGEKISSSGNLRFPISRITAACGFIGLVVADRLSTSSTLLNLQDWLNRQDMSAQIRRGSRTSYRAKLLGVKKTEL